MTDRAQKFIRANDASPVVYGAAIEPNPTKPAKGARYRLEDGRRFILSVADCRALPDGYPRWVL